MSKMITIKRKTSETDIEIGLVPYGKGTYDIKTGIAFLDHMLSLFAKHGLFDLKIKAKGDLEVDIHHTNEDVAIVLGEVFSKVLGSKAGIKRFGEANVPMDEALVRVAIDISGRPFLAFQSVSVSSKKDADTYNLGDAEHFLRAFVNKFGATVHVDVLKGSDMHHIIEAIFKAFAKALSRAVEKESRFKGVPSTKGRI